MLESCFLQGKNSRFLPSKKIMKKYFYATYQLDRLLKLIKLKSSDERYIENRILALSAKPNFLTIITKISIELMLTHSKSTSSPK